ncbi:hypothetical protein BZA70DRAFT_63990 [Myxozyma melibiosi]|uniref:Mitochondrial zinc maintenance protein 1, mitochondrial n=1 Tax=Myxozyma melibiosi TaxID=54550 RepID=A0ABR1F238_9ASCO
MASRRTQVLATYRNLLRSARIAFDQDLRMRTAAHAQMRAQMDLGRRELGDSPADFDEIDKRLEHAAGVCLILRSNIAQGVLEKDAQGNPVQKNEEERERKVGTVELEGGEGSATTEEGVFKLRLHKYSELGDNEAVKGGKTTLSGRGKRINWQQPSSQ